MSNFSASLWYSRFRNWLSKLSASGAQRDPLLIGMGVTLAQESNDTQNEALEMLLQGDFAPDVREQARVFANASGMEHRFLNLVQLYVAEVATLYDRRPSRVFGTRDTDPAVYRKLREVYENSEIDDFQRQTLRALYCHSAVVQVVLPCSGMRKVRPLLFAPHEVRVDCSNPLYASDLAYAREVRFRVPVSEDSNSIRFGELVMNADEIYIAEQDGSDKRAVYGDSTANPFDGQIPAVVIRRQAPPKGHFFPTPDQSLLQEAVQLCMNLANLDQVVRSTAFPLRCLIASEGENILQSELDGLPIGPEKWISLPAGCSLEVVHSQPQIAEMQNRIEADLKSFAVMRGLAPDSFLRTYTNIAAKKLEQHDRRVARKKIARVMEKGEKALCKLIAQVLNVTELVTFDVAQLDCRLRWAEWVIEADDQSAAQARQLAYQAGEANPIEYIAARDNIDRKTAAQRYQQNLTATPSEGEAAA